MLLVKSPKVEYSPDGKPPERKDWRRIIMRAGLGLLFVLSVALNLYAFGAGNIANLLAGTNGVAEGIVLDEEGNPIAAAEITLAAAPNARTFTSPDGTFTLSNIPTGPHYLIVVHRNIGEGFVVNIESNGVTQVGSLTYTAMPAEWR